MSDFYLSRRSKQHRRGVDQKLIEISDLAIKITKIDFGIPDTGGVRTIDTQRRLYEQNRSPADGTNNISKHQLGLALDFYAYVNGRASWNERHLAMVAAAHLQAASMLGNKIQWGGLWDSKDMPHIELMEEVNPLECTS